MKKYSLAFVMSIMTMIVAGISACSGGEDEPVVPEFPTQKTINVTANNEQSFSFTANMDWRLSSNKAWCRLASSEMEGQNISGKAGSQSIKIKVSDEGQDFEEAKATLTMSMGTESKVIAEVVRAGKEYELKVFNAEGKEVQSLAISSEGTLDFTVEANFDCGATVPAWLEDVVLKDANGKKAGTLKVKEGQDKNAQSGSITFANQNGSASFTIPVSYEGMDVNKIIIRLKDSESGSFNGWNWEVSLDGKTFSKNNDVNGTTEEIKDKMTFTIIARNDEYTPVFASVTGGEYTFLKENESWMHLTKDGETATLTIDATDKAREGYILILPNSIYNEVKDDLKGKLLEKDADGKTVIKNEQKYLLISFKQKDASTGLRVRIDRNTKDAVITDETDESILNKLQADYGITEVYATKLGAAAPIIIFPEISDKETECTVITLSGRVVDVHKELGGFEGSIFDSFSPNFCIQIITPNPFSEGLIVLFKDENGTYKKALVIRPA